MPFDRQQKTYLARFCRKQVIRGRNGVGYFSTEGHETAPDEPQMADRAKRAQHYGLTTEPPDGTECVTLAINGGASNRVSVAEYTTGEPEIEAAEVLLWTTYGHRILLAKSGDVIVTPAAGKHVLLGGADATDPVVTKSTLDAAIDVFNHHVHGVSHATAGPYPVSGSSDGPSSGMALSPDRVAQTK